jgi:phytoene synthase
MPDAFAHCQALVRAADRDRFLATLFAPAEHRAALFALYAFNVEITRVREVAREPAAGEIRLQWWSDTLSGSGRGEAMSYPEAAALLACIASYRLPAEGFEALIAARRFDLYDEPMATLADLETYAEGASSELIALAAHILLGGRRVEVRELSYHAGIAHALAGLLKAFPVHAARGQLFVPLEILQRHEAGPQDVARRPATTQLRAALGELRRRARHHLERAQELMAAAPPAVLPALLPVAPAPLLLARMERHGHDPFVPVEIPAWRRQWLIWRAARHPSRMFL